MALKGVGSVIFKARFDGLESTLAKMLELSFVVMLWRYQAMSDPYESSRNPYAPPLASGLANANDKPKGDGSGKATASFVLGLVSIITWMIPLFGLPTTIIGLVLGIKGLGSPRQGLAITGIVLSSIFLILVILNAAVGAYLGATGQLQFFK